MKLINLGLEAIAFQTPDLANKMAKLLEEVMQERSSKTADTSAAKKDLVKLLGDSTGMKLDIVFDTPIAPAVLPFHINPDSVLGYSSLKDYYGEESKATMERLKKIKTTSSIDLKNARVTGIFSEIAIPIYLGFDHLKSYKLSGRQMAAVLAHEVGHAFVAFELAFRTVRTNQILSAIAKAHAGGDRNTYTYALKTTEEIIGAKTGVTEQLIEQKNGAVVATVVLGEINKKNHEESVMGNTSYDINSFEALADNFATRMGLGLELTTALEKMHKNMGAAEFSTTARVALTVSDIFSTAVIASGAIMLATGMMPFIASYTLVMVSLGVYLGLDGRDQSNVYDKLKVRFKRIKEQQIQFLKDNKLPPKDVKNVLESVAHIEKIIDEISEYKGFLPAVLNLIDPASRAVNKASDVQQKLEALASNELYLKAAQLRTLA